MYEGDCGFSTRIMSKQDWLYWFDEYGNKGDDGWKNSQDWFEDMIRCGLIREV